jgi:predicted transcriptional regulator
LETVFAEARWFHDAGVNLWHDDGIEAGTTWRRAIAEALDQTAGVIFMCTKNSVASSHCQKELNYALDHDKPIFVVRLDRMAWTVDDPGNWISWWSLANCLGYLDDKEQVAQIMQGLRDNGFGGTVAQVEVGTRRVWGRSEFADTLLNGLKRLGYE